MSVSGLRKTLQNTNFAKLWIGQIVSNLGDEVAFFGIAVLVVFSWGGSAVDVSIVMIASSLPVLLFGPIAGVFVDRWNKKITMIAADMIRAILALIFIFCTSVIQLAVVVFLISTASRFFYPARMSLIPEIMERDILVEANSLSQVTYMSAVILGPVISTGMIYVLGYLWIFVFDSLTYIFSALMLLTIRYKRHYAKATEKNALNEMIEGFKYILKNPAVKAIIMAFVLMMLFVGGLNAAYSVYVRDVLHMNITGYGLMEVLFGIGTIVGSVSTGILAGKMKSGRMVFLGIFGIGLMIFLMGAFPIPIIAMTAGGFTIGFFVAFVDGPSSAILQRAVEEKFRGRVFSAVGALVQSAALVSLVMIGLLISLFGVLPVIFVSGCVVSIVGLYLLLSAKVNKIVDV